MKVNVESMTAKNILSDVLIYGHTEAYGKIPLKIRTSGVVERILHKKGSYVKKGETILRLRMEDRQAKLRKAEIEFNTSKHLLAQDLISKSEYAQMEAAYKSALETYDQVDVKAPFDGVVDTLGVEAGQYVASGNEIGTFLNLNPIKIRAEIPERYITRVKKGSVARAQLSSGQEIDAMLTYVGAVANASTRTFSIELEAPNRNYGIVEGLTAEIRLPLDTIPAVKLTVSSCLTFGDDGQVGLKAINADNVVEFYPVDLVREEKDGLWVSGLPAKANVIIAGQEYVRIGEKVDPSFINPDEAAGK
jgi:multidrug efflux system membrane fusion protein